MCLILIIRQKCWQTQQYYWIRGQLMRMTIRLFRLMKKVLSGYFQLLMELQDLLISIKVKNRMI